MRAKYFLCVVGLSVLAVSPAGAQVTGGVLSATQTHMSWWGGVARDATARQYDVDADAVVLDQKTGTITFRAKPGRLVDLDKLHESIWATRLSGNTGMRLNWIDVTAVGQVVRDKDQLRLQVAGSDAYFVLMDDPAAKEPTKERTPYRRLREALDRGEKVVSVTGRLGGWTGHFPVFLKTLPEKPRRIIVKEFQTAAK